MYCAYTLWTSLAQASNVAQGLPLGAAMQQLLAPASPTKACAGLLVLSQATPPLQLIGTSPCQPGQSLQNWCGAALVVFLYWHVAPRSWILTVRRGAPPGLMSS